MIPVYEPLFKGNESKYLSQCISSGEVSGAGGKFVERFEAQFAEYANTKYGVAVCNGTAALETALWACGVRSGKIIMPASTIISCAVATLRVGAIPEFVDITKDCVMEEVSTVPQETTAVMPVHLFGNLSPAGYLSLPTIDDFSQYWSPMMYIRDAGVYSLYSNKLITAGEGGIVVTNHKEVYDNAKRYRNLCHSSERFYHTDVGYNFRMSNLQAALALAQLEQIEKFAKIKVDNLDIYKQNLPKEVRLLCDNILPWMYLIETKVPTDLIVPQLHKKGIETRKFFFPLHKQPCLTHLNQSHKWLPNSEHARKYWFYLPSGLTLKDKDIEHICECLKEVVG